MKLPRPLSASIDQVARTAMGKDWSLYATLLDHWADLVGPTYAKETAPVKITFPKGKRTQDSWASKMREGGGVLTIRLPQGLVMDFNFQTEILRQRINLLFGYEAIGKIALAPYYGSSIPSCANPTSHRTPLSEKDKESLHERLKDVENNELRDVLRRLGESVLAADKKR